MPPPVQQSSLRLLVLAPSSEPTAIPPFPALLEAITGSRPSNEITSFTGYTSHPPLALRTKYYSSDVSIWCDELPAVAGSGSETEPSAVRKIQTDESDNPSTIEEWKQQMLSPEASEVRAVIGGIVLALPISSRSTSPIPDTYYSLIEAVHALREAVEEEGYGRDVASIVVLQSTSPTLSPGKLESTAEEIEDACLSGRGILGWDFVTWNGEAQSPSDADRQAERNEYGERVGIKRVIEVLEGIDWSAEPEFGNFEDGAGLRLDQEGGEEQESSKKDILGDSSLFDLDYELQREMMELKMSMLDGDPTDDSKPGGQGLHEPGFDLQYELERELMEMTISQPDQNSHGDNDQPGAETKARSPVDEDFQVEQLPGLMERVVAIREAASEMAKGEKERFARREIARIMRDMG